MKETIVISLGGSIIVPDAVDSVFLRKFKALILKQLKKGQRFVLVCGGGRTCRRYNAGAEKVSRIAVDDLDWMGIAATRLNATLVRSIFGKAAHKDIMMSPEDAVGVKGKIIVSGGWKPGWSTDTMAVLIAKHIGAKKVVNLSNIAYAYDKDPKKFKDAKRIISIDWKGFRKIVGNKWIPGMNLPFDPVASRIAANSKMRVAIMKGTALANLSNFLNGKKFKGTVIE